MTDVLTTCGSHFENLIDCRQVIDLIDRLPIKITVDLSVQ